MKRFRRVVPLLLAGLLVAGAAVAASVVREFEADPLTGAEEVPMRATFASGEAEFKVNRAVTALRFELEAEDISNVVQAHIHVGPPGENGPVVAFLYGPTAAGGGPVEIEAKGVVTSTNLVGPLAGQPLSALVHEMTTGNTYVNVHTDDGVAPANTGAGDFPGGEIRGQIRSGD